MKRALWLPFTAAFLAVMVAAALWSGTWRGPISPDTLRAVGISLDALTQGRLHVLATSIFFSNRPFMLYGQLIFAAIVIGLVEYRYGAIRTAFWFGLLDFGGTLALFFLVVLPLSLFDRPDEMRMAAETDVGMSGGGFGFVGLLIGGLKPQWRTGAIVLLYAYMLVRLIFFTEFLADTLHIITSTAGLIVARSGIIARKT